MVIQHSPVGGHKFHGKHNTSVLRADPKMGETHSPTKHKFENVHTRNIYTANIHVHSSASCGKPLK